MSRGIYTTRCLPFPSISPSGMTGSLVIPSDSYFPNPFYDPPPLNAPLPLRLELTQYSTGTTEIDYQFIFSDNEGLNQTANVIMNFTGTGPTGQYKYTVQSLPSLEIVVVPIIDTNIHYGDPFDVLATWKEDRLTTIGTGHFDNNDTYVIPFNQECGGMPGLNVGFLRTLGLVLTTGDEGGIATNLILSNTIQQCDCKQKRCDKVIVPIINIEGQTTISDHGGYLSDMKFTIQDEYSYYDYCPKHVKNQHKHCKTLYYPFDKLKKTVFLEFNPKMQDVVKGKGKTLRDKLSYYYNIHEVLIGVGFQTFYDRIVQYGMFKYILAKLLYGDFNIRYLCRNFNCQFFKDLKQSRFCGFVQAFKTPVNLIGYDKYFIKCDQSC
jgi:hypothetical protein